MKRTLSLVLVLLALCGCTSQTEPAAAPAQSPATAPIPTAEPEGLYDAGSKLEVHSNGAVRTYPLHRSDSLGIAHMGDDVLLFTGTNATTLIKYSGENLSISAVANLTCSIYPSDAAVQVSQSGVAYYDEKQNDLVFLNAQLEEVRRVDLPETICGTIALSTDCQTLYYCTADALRCIDLESGLDRLLKEMNFVEQIPTALHCGDTILVCSVQDAEGNWYELYISTETGQLLHETMGDVQLWTKDSFYFAVHQDGPYQELLIGDSEQGPTLLNPHTYGIAAYPVLDIGGAVLLSEDTEADTFQLDYYDLRSGKLTNILTLDSREPLYGFHAEASQQAVWFLRYDPEYHCDVLHRWDLTQAPLSGGASCFSARYTAEKPDYFGLAACRATADELSQKYGVQILLWTDATAFQPWDYTLVPEYQVPVIREELKKLETLLSMYPEDFLIKAAERTGCGRIQICLVRSILGNAPAEGALRDAIGLQYWDDNANAYVSLAVAREQLVQNACHEIFHIIESRVITDCKAYDDWNALNPAKFQYDNDYITNLSREDTQWTEGKDRAFIDTYSMSYPKEDRARIMEFAMMPGNEAFFESETMQLKLHKLCLGIRQAFGLKKSPESFLWEQYLKEPLN